MISFPWPIKIFIGTILLTLSWLTVLLVVTARAEVACLDQGYPSVRVTWKFDAYCIALDGTTKTVVKPIGD